MHQHSGSVRGGYMLQSRALPQQVHHISLVRKYAELHLLILVVISHVVIADEVGNGRGRNGCLEQAGLSDQPGAKLSTITHALDADAIAIDPQVAAHGSADAIEHILRFVSVLIAKDTIREFLAIAG